MFARLVLAPAAFVLGLLMPVQAHDIYSLLTDRWGQKCCDETDCRPARYRLAFGRVEMLVDGQWIPVPDEAIQYRALPGDTSEMGGGHWCGFASRPTDLDADPVYTTRCAILPPQATSARYDLMTRGKLRPVDTIR